MDAAEKTGLASAFEAIPDEIKKATVEAYGSLVEKIKSNEDRLKQENTKHSEMPKSWLVDPFGVLESMGMGYRHNPSVVTYETLRIASERNDIISAIILTRVNQVASFARPQRNKYSVGFKILPRGSEKMRRLTDSEKRRATRIERFLLDTGSEPHPDRDAFETMVKKFTRDRLTYDQACFEKIPTWGGSLHSFLTVPGDTIRIAHPKIRQGTPDPDAEYKKRLKYVQLINGQITAEYTQKELAFCVANPRTHVKVGGYGMPEIEMLLTTITAHLWAEEWNRRMFSQGSTIKGVLNLKGNIPKEQFEAFKRQWTAQVAGVSNAWRTPVTNTEGMEWFPLQLSNTEMGYNLWMEYLIKIITAIYQIDPAEINFDLRGGSMQQPMFMSSNEAQQKVSKDRGLQPLLRFIADSINRHIVWPLDPEFELEFVGLDAKTEEQAMELRMKQVQNIYTLNEVRAMEDLPKVENGDVVLNATYTGALQQANMMKQQQQQGGGAPGGPPQGGGADQGGDAPPDPSQPYGGQFQAPAGKEEEQGGEAIRQAHEKVKGKKESSSGDDDSFENIMHIQDWDSSIHSSVRDSNLLKAGMYFDTLELE